MILSKNNDKTEKKLYTICQKSLHTIRIKRYTSTDRFIEKENIDLPNNSIVTTTVSNEKSTSHVEKWLPIFTYTELLK